MKIFTKLLLLFLPLALAPAAVAGYLGIQGIWSISQETDRVSSSIEQLDISAKESIRGIEAAVIAQVLSDYGYLSRQLRHSLELRHADLLRVMDTVAESNLLEMFLGGEQDQAYVDTIQVLPLFQQVIDNYSVVELSILDLEGREMLRRTADVVPPGGDPLFDSEPLPNQSQDEGDSPWFLERLADQRASVLTAVYFTDDFPQPEPVLSLTAALKYKLGRYDPLYGDTKAYLHLVMRMSELTRHLFQTDTGFEGTIILTDNQGRIVAHPDPARRGEFLDQAALLDPDRHVIREQALDGLLTIYVQAPQERIEQTTDIVRNLAAGIGKGVGLAQSLSRDVDRRLDDSQWRVLGISCLLLAAVTVMVSVAARRISAPLSVLARAASAVAQGDLERRPEVNRNAGQEIAMLARNLDEMRLNLKAQIENLDRMVAERTLELMAAKDEAEKGSRAKSAFLAHMSHELRTPLNAILGLSRILSQNRGMPAEHMEALKIINESGESLLSLINDVLDMSKIEAGRAVLNEKECRLHRLLLDIRDMFSIRATQKGLSLELTMDPGVPCQVRMDDAKLRQILVNLISNAIKFTRKGGVRVNVECTDNGETDLLALEFAVEDTGVGIPADELEAIFDPFIQASSGKDMREGTGLGLSISRRNAELMGGAMEVSSRVGRGSVFRFSVKAWRSSGRETQPALDVGRRVVGLKPGQPRYRILVADDSYTNRLVLVSLLKPLGFDVIEAETGLEAVETWRTFRPHVIWMDKRMPGMSGYEAAERIKGAPGGEETVIIGVSASAFEDDAAEALAAGCDAFLRKPFRGLEVLEMMREHLGISYLYEDENGGR